MSAFKFACPVCGQHITCEPDKAGSQMECPTCFRKIVVPEPPASEDSKFILTASQVQSRPIPQAALALGPDKPAAPQELSMRMFALVAVLCVLGGVFLGLHARWVKSSQTSSQGDMKTKQIVKKVKPGTGKINPAVVQTNFVTGTSQTSSAAMLSPLMDTNWTLNLEGVVIPSWQAKGQLKGRSFTCERASLRGGTLSLRQGSARPADAALSIYLFAKQGEDLAGKTINITTNFDNPPRIAMRRKDNFDRLIPEPITGRYALRLEFGALANKRMPGKIYLCLADDAKSYVTGKFEAEIRPPEMPRPETSQPEPPKPPKRPR